MIDLDGWMEEPLFPDWDGMECNGSRDKTLCLFPTTQPTQIARHLPSFPS